MTDRKQVIIRTEAAQHNVEFQESGGGIPQGATPGEAGRVIPSLARP